RSVRCGVRPFLQIGRCGTRDFSRSLRGGARGRILRRGERSLLRIAACAAQGFSAPLRAVHRLLPAGSGKAPERMKTLLIVYHTGGVKTAKMAEAVERGAREGSREALGESGVNVVMKRCADAGPED